MRRFSIQACGGGLGANYRAVSGWEDILISVLVPLLEHFTASTQAPRKITNDRHEGATLAFVKGWGDFGHDATVGAMT